MNRPKRLLVLCAAVITIAAVLTITASAQTEGTVDATITSKVIAISVSPDELVYSSVEPKATKLKPSPDHFDVETVGSENVILSIRGSNTEDWTLHTSPGPNQYVHKFARGSGASFVALGTEAQPYFGTNILPPDSVFNVFLELDMPTTTTTFDVQTANVTVIATEATP